MRELDIRIWSIKDKKMIYPTLTRSHGMIGYKIAYINKSVNNFVIMQSLDIVPDSKSKKIYEKDLLIGCEGLVYKFEWDKEEGKWMLYFIESVENGKIKWDWDHQLDDFYISDFDKQRLYLTVIGNELENPEILEKISRGEKIEFDA